MPTEENVLNYWKERLRKDEKKINKENYESARKHINRLEDINRSPRTVINHLMALLPFLKAVKKPINKLTETNLEDYFDTLKLSKMSIKFHKSTVRAFINEINPTLAATVKSPTIKNKLKPADMLQLEDIEKLIDASENLRDKALIAVYYDSGARKGEVLSCCIEDAAFDNYGCRLWLNKSKTFERRVRLTFASSYLRAWLDCHPTKGNLKSPIFCSLKPSYGLLSDTGLYHRIIKIHNKAGIKRKATPRHIRHSRATNLVKKLNGSEQKLKSIMGWEQNSRMASTYVHLDDNDVDEMMLEAAGIKKEEEKPGKPLNYKCQRCGEINAVTQKRCWKCGFSEDDPIIDEETIAKSVEEIVLEKLQAQGFIIGSKPLKKESNRKYIEKEE